MTITYRDMSFCSDGPACAAKDCARRFTESDLSKAKAIGLPGAWMSRRETCSSFVERKKAMKARNIEAVHAAVAAGAKTHAELEDATNLSQSTVKKALYALEEWPGGARISRDRRFVTHTFEAIG